MYVLRHVKLHVLSLSGSRLADHCKRTSLGTPLATILLACITRECECNMLFVPRSCLLTRPKFAVSGFCATGHGPLP